MEYENSILWWCMKAYNTRKSPNQHWEKFDLTWIHPVYGEIQQRGLIHKEFFARPENGSWKGPFEKRFLAEEFLKNFHSKKAEV